MKGITLMTNEKLIKKSGRTTYITSKLGGKQGIVYLTNNRLIFCKINSILVALLGAFSKLLKGKTELVVPLTEISAISKTKIQLSNNILVISTHEGCDYKFDLNYNEWSQHILEALRCYPVSITKIDESKWQIQKN